MPCSRTRNSIGSARMAMRALLKIRCRHPRAAKNFHAHYLPISFSACQRAAATLKKWQPSRVRPGVTQPWRERTLGNELPPPESQSQV